MSKKNLLLVLEIVLLLVVSTSLAGCGGGGRTSSQATPRATAPHRLDTDPSGLPLYCPAYIKHDQQGNLYVTGSDEGQRNSHRARVVKLSPTGQLLSEWHVFTAFPPGGFAGPFG